jgi:cell pole-organizing protein PopZ
MSKPAAKAQEPSMEEILASIRRIISDEGSSQGGQAATTTAAPVTELSAPVRTAPPSLAPSKPAPVLRDEPDVLELTEVVETKIPSTYRPADDTDEPEPMFREPQEMRAAPAALATRSATPVDDRLLSQNTSSAVSAAFDTLANNIFSASGDAGNMFAGPHGSLTIDEVVREMLKPMLKTWLEENLPSLVERLVRTEIERVSRGGR